MPTAFARGWAQLLKDFSRRNAGRGTRLEIEDAELGAQLGELDLHLRGVAFEPRFRRVEIMLTDGGATEHLTHSIEGVSDVAVQLDAAGRDATLRIAHPGGQTLLMLA
jgi:Ser/Thr protein kinase RdoA (MazF antagonist)